VILSAKRPEEGQHNHGVAHQLSKALTPKDKDKERKIINASSPQTRSRFEKKKSITRKADHP
jgi:hypothetical protein